jgi:hypothetical protein
VVRTIDLFSGARCDGYAPAYAYELLDINLSANANPSTFLLAIIV